MTHHDCCSSHSLSRMELGMEEDCGCSCGCSCGYEGGFMRRFPTREEKIAGLESYKDQLEKELQGVREKIEMLKSE